MAIPKLTEDTCKIHFDELNLSELKIFLPQVAVVEIMKRMKMSKQFWMRSSNITGFMNIKMTREITKNI